MGRAVQRSPVDVGRRTTRLLSVASERVQHDRPGRDKPVSQIQLACYRRPMSKPLALSGGSRDVATKRPYGYLKLVRRAVACLPPVDPRSRAHP